VGLSGLLIGCLLAVSIIALASPVNAVVDPTVTRAAPATVQPGELFEVTVTFTATGNQFTAALEDYAPNVPSNWIVTAAAAGCTPSGGSVGAVNNHFTIMWLESFDAGTQFTACYQVTVPADATPRVYDFPNGVVRYTLGPEGEEVEYEVDITGDSQVEILPEYDLTLSRSTGGSVTRPGEGTFA